MSVIRLARHFMRVLPLICLAACGDDMPGTATLVPDRSLAQSATADVVFEKEAARFLAALFSTGESDLIKYERFPGALVDSGRLRPRIREFIDGPLARVKAGPPLVPILDGRSGHLFTVLFVQRDSVQRARDQKFLRSQYLVAYFACAFDDSSGSWRLRDGFCFDETDGPYPNDDPDL